MRDRQLLWAMFQLATLFLLFAGRAEAQACCGLTGDDCDPCLLQRNPCRCRCLTPIVIDTTGNDFQLTDVDHGVSFDFFGDGHPVQMAWTATGRGVAFLVLDRNSNGKIDSGAELFGNTTPQSDSAGRNGFAALAEFDKVENGGNGDGVIDSRDAVFSSLRFWIDDNHDGVSQPNELRKLSDVGITSISLDYHEARRIDRFGNQFRFKALVNQSIGRTVNQRWAYDVFFKFRTD
jgi:hypothetical protein